MKKFGLFVAAAAAAFAVSNAAHAVTFTSVAGDGGPAPGETLIADFNDQVDGNVAAGYSLTGGVFRPHGTIPGAAADPFPITPGDGYFSVQGGGLASLTTPLLQSFSLYIGSLDTYNTIVFHFAGGGSKVYGQGGESLNPGGGGNQSNAADNRRFYFDFEGQLVNQIDFASSSQAFEMDNFAGAVAAIPEPATWAMMITGFGLMGATLRRRRRLSAAAV